MGLGVGGRYRNNLSSHSDLTFKSLSGLENIHKINGENFSLLFLLFLGAMLDSVTKTYFFLSVCLMFSCPPGINKSATLVLSWGQLCPLKDSWQCLGTFLVVIMEEVLLASSG